VDRSLVEVEVISGLVEGSRDAAGRVPAELEPLLDRLPDGIADRVKRGAIRYRPSADRRTFEVTATLGAG
jgi:hypothetical protein